MKILQIKGKMLDGTEVKLSDLFERGKTEERTFIAKYVVGSGYDSDEKYLFFRFAEHDPEHRREASHLSIMGDLVREIAQDEPMLTLSDLMLHQNHHGPVQLFSKHEDDFRLSCGIRGGGVLYVKPRFKTVLLCGISRSLSGEPGTEVLQHLVHQDAAEVIEEEVKAAGYELVIEQPR